MIVQLTAAGQALLDANTGPVTITSFKLGSAFGYIPQASDTNIHGALVYTGVPSAPLAVSGNIVKYGAYLDWGTGPFQFGEIGLFVGSTLFALGVNDQSLTKTPLGYQGANAIRLDTYLSVVSTNYEMWLDLAETDNQFRMAILGSPDQLPQPQNAVPNAYVISGASEGQAAFLAYTDRSGMWVFDAYDFLSSLAATVVSSGPSSVTIDIGDYQVQMTPTYLGQVIVEFSSGKLYGLCRYVSGTVNNGSTVTLNFDSPLAIQPAQGDIFRVYIRQVASTTIPFPIASRTRLGGVIVGQSLTVDPTGVIDVDQSKLPVAPVQSVAGRTGNVTLSYTDISGLATVAHTGLYSDLIGAPSGYILPVASTVQLGGVMARTGSHVTINSSGVIDIDFTPVTSVAGRTGAVILTKEDITDLAVFGPSGDSHSSGLVPDPGSTAGTKRLLGEDGQWKLQPYDIMAFYPANPVSGTLLYRIILPRSVSFAAGSSGATGCVSSAITAPTGAVTMNIQQNGSTVATITYNAGSAVGTVNFPSAVVFAANDVLTIVCNTTDTTLSGVSVTLTGTR